MFKSVYLTHKNFWTRQTITMLAWALVWFALALVIQHFAYNYIDNRASTTHVGDLILGHLPVFNLHFFIVQGALITTLIALIAFLVRPKYLPFSLKTLALFIIIRSFFISLTHLGVNLHQITLNTSSIGFGLYDFLYNGKNDFFFSGHVGVTFLLALIFWKEKTARITFLSICVIFAASMLFAHMHYSIDIFAAPFITYAIFAASKAIFKKDYDLWGKAQTSNP